MTAALGRGEINLIRARRMAELASRGSPRPRLSGARRARFRAWVERPRPSGMRRLRSRARARARRPAHHPPGDRAPPFRLPDVAVCARWRRRGRHGPLHRQSRTAGAAGGHRRSQRPRRRGDRRHRRAAARRWRRPCWPSSSRGTRRSCSIRPGRRTTGHVRWPAACPYTSPAGPQDGFEPDPERVRAAITPRTRLLVVSSPSNPTGAVIEPENLAALAAPAGTGTSLVLSDEIYASFVYDGTRTARSPPSPG